MEMIWLARMDEMEAVPKSQPRKFHLFGPVSDPCSVNCDGGKGKW